MSAENFYSELDLRYPELAYNKRVIVRSNPGTVPFYIPSLYPNMSGGVRINNKISQNNSGIVNKEKPTINKITISNYIDIKVPQELCSGSGTLIPIDSTWVVMFLGGDINRPVIISRCYA